MRGFYDIIINKKAFDFVPITSKWF